MDTLIKVFDWLVSTFNVLLANTEFGALAVGTLAAVSVTQVVKMWVIQFRPTNGGRGLWYSFQFIIGLAVTFMNWPTMLGFSWGLAIGGLFSPGLYVLGTRALYKFYPDAESRISATPRNP